VKLRRFRQLLISKKHGFSLVELMIVVAIIGLLASIGIPTLRGFVARQRQAQAQTYLTQIQVLEKIYFADNYTYWPTTSADDGSLTPLVTDGVSVGFNDLHFYPLEAAGDIYYNLSVGTFSPPGTVDASDSSITISAPMNQFVALAVDRSARHVISGKGRDRWIATRDCVCCTRDAVKATSATVPAAASAWTRNCVRKCGTDNAPAGMTLP